MQELRPTLVRSSSSSSTRSSMQCSDIASQLDED